MMKKHILLIPAFILLAACGSGGEDNPASTASTGSGQTSTMSQADSFLSTVTSVVEASSDITEAAPLDATPPSATEDSEPMPLS
jgi:hypothetical protein